MMTSSVAGRGLKKKNMATVSRRGIGWHPWDWYLFTFDEEQVFGEVR